MNHSGNDGYTLETLVGGQAREEFLANSTEGTYEEMVDAYLLTPWLVEAMADCGNPDSETYDPDFSPDNARRVLLTWLRGPQA